MDGTSWEKGLASSGKWNHGIAFMWHQGPYSSAWGCYSASSLDGIVPDAFVLVLCLLRLFCSFITAPSPLTTDALTWNVHGKLLKAAWLFASLLSEQQLLSKRPVAFVLDVR